MCIFYSFLGGEFRRDPKPHVFFLVALFVLSFCLGGYPSKRDKPAPFLWCPSLTRTHNSEPQTCMTISTEMDREFLGQKKRAEPYHLRGLTFSCSNGTPHYTLNLNTEPDGWEPPGKLIQHRRTSPSHITWKLSLSLTPLVQEMVCT